MKNFDWCSLTSTGRTFSSFFHQVYSFCFHCLQDAIPAEEMIVNFRLPFMEKNRQIVGIFVVMTNSAKLLNFSKFTTLILCFLQQFAVTRHFCRVSNNFSCVRKFSRKLTIFYRSKKLKYSKIEFFHFFGEKNHSWPWTSKSFWRTNLLASIAPIGYCFRALPFQAISVIICPEPFVNRLVNCGLNFFAWFRVLNFRLENLYDKKELAELSLLTP